MGDKENGTGIAGPPDARTGNIELYRGDCMEAMRRMPDGSVDIVLTDPPYMYLGHRLDAPFDIGAALAELRRVLKKDRGALAVFGRGPSFYRTGAELERLGLRFLEEVVWHKGRRSSPVSPLGRVHETVSVWGLGRARINRARVPAAEEFRCDPQRILGALDGMAGYLKNPADMAAMREFAETGMMKMAAAQKSSITISGGRRPNRAAAVLRSLVEGGLEESVVRVSAMADGRDRLHPTQKPVALLKRLLALVMPPGREARDVTVLDPFGGSFSTMAACMEMGARGISCEILPDYFDKGAARLESIARRGRQAELGLG